MITATTAASTTREASIDRLPRKASQVEASTTGLTIGAASM